MALELFLMNYHKPIVILNLFTFHTKIPLAVGCGRKYLPSFNIV